MEELPEEAQPSVRVKTMVSCEVPSSSTGLFATAQPSIEFATTAISEKLPVRHEYLST